MNQSILSVRLSSEDKKQFEEFCSQTGMNVSICVNMFIKAVLRERRLPFEVKSFVNVKGESMSRVTKLYPID